LVALAGAAGDRPGLEQPEAAAFAFPHPGPFHVARLAVQGLHPPPEFGQLAELAFVQAGLLPALGGDGALALGRYLDCLGGDVALEDLAGVAVEVIAVRCDPAGDDALAQATRSLDQHARP